MNSRCSGAPFGIAIESVARAPFGQPVRTPTLARAEIAWVDVEVEALHRLLTQIVEAAATLGEDEVVPHLLEAGRGGATRRLLAVRTPAYVSRIAPSSRQQTIWRLPPVAEDPPGLDEAERASVEAAHSALVASLAELRRRYPPRGRLALTGHAHIDLAWLWPYDETRRSSGAHSIRRSDCCAAIPSSASINRPRITMRNSRRTIRALLAEIVEAAREGRWETLGGMWVEPDTNMPTGETFVRQLLYGQRYFERVFGARSRVCWLPDCFGFSPALPQLLRQAGIDSFFTIKVNWSETNKFPHDLFWWEGLNGARVLAHTFDNPYGGYNGQVRPNAYMPTWKNFRGKINHDDRCSRSALATAAAA